MQAQPNCRNTNALSRSDWVVAAMDALVAEGEGGVRIDRLCRDLGVTKGSFYHHFGSRRELVDAVGEYWARVQPAQVIADLKRAAPAPSSDWLR